MAFAGAAAAEVKITGSAEMGIAGGDGRDVLFHQSVDARIAMTGTSDGGLSFGATVDLDDLTDMGTAGNGAGDIQGKNPDYTTFIKGDFGTLTMGDTDGAFDWALTEVAMLSSIADDHTAHAGYNGNSGLDGSLNGQVARYDYSFGDFAIAVSAEVRGDTDAVAGTAGTCIDALAVTSVVAAGATCPAGSTRLSGSDPVAAVKADTALGLGVKWSGDMGGAKLSLGAGVQSNDSRTISGMSAKVSSNGFDVVVNYSDLDGQTATANDSHMAIGVGYTTGALSMTANYGVYELVNGTEKKGYGAAVNYDLGGGAVGMLGYGNTDGGDSTWSAGLGLSF